MPINRIITEPSFHSIPHFPHPQGCRPWITVFCRIRFQSISFIIHHYPPLISTVKLHCYLDFTPIWWTNVCRGHHFINKCDWSSIRYENFLQDCNNYTNLYCGPFLCNSRALTYKCYLMVTISPHTLRQRVSRRKSLKQNTLNKQPRKLTEGGHQHQVPTIYSPLKHFNILLLSPSSPMPPSTPKNKLLFTSLLYCMPPSDALGLLLVLLVCSLLAGQVGNILSSMGKGDSLKYSCTRDSSADILLVGLYVKNLHRTKKENEQQSFFWDHFSWTIGSKQEGKKRKEMPKIIQHL